MRNAGCETQSETEVARTGRSPAAETSALNSRSIHSAMLATAEGLKRDCQQLQLSLALMERDLNDDEAESLKHLERSTQLRRRITDAAQSLQRYQAEGKNLPVSSRDALRHQVQQCQRLLAESSEASARLARKANDLRAELAQQLHDMRRGSKMLGSYKAHARVIAEYGLRKAE